MLGEKIMRHPIIACCATARALRQVAAHQNRIQLFPILLAVITLAAARHGKPGALVEPPRRLIVLLDLEEHGANAASGEMAEMGQQQVVGQTASAMARPASRRFAQGRRLDRRRAAAPPFGEPCHHDGR
jgi:hypothetical protein